MTPPTLPEGTTKLVTDWYHGTVDFPEDTEMCQTCQGSGCDNCIRGLKMDGPKAEVYGDLGDIRCPHCDLVHMTPANCQVQPGILNCQQCKEVSIVTKEIADRCRNPGWRAA